MDVLKKYHKWMGEPDSNEGGLRKKDTNLTETTKPEVSTKAIIGKNLTQLFSNEYQTYKLKLRFSGPLNYDPEDYGKIGTMEYKAQVRIKINHSSLSVEVGFFDIPIHTSENPKKIMSCLLETHNPDKEWAPPLSNTLKTINNGWVHVARKIGEYIYWKHSHPINSTPNGETFDYEMIWTATPTDEFIFSKRMFTIKSSCSGGEIRFSIKTDKDTEFKIFNISEIDSLLLHITNHFKVRYIPFSTQYTQLTRIEAVLDNILISL
jgi:hypothetical protein